MLAGAAAGLQHVAGFAGEELLQHRPDRRMVAVERRRIEPAVGLDRPAILAEFHDIFRHRALLPSALDRRRRRLQKLRPDIRRDTAEQSGAIPADFARAHRTVDPRLLSALPADGLYAFHPLYSARDHRHNARETPLIAPFSTKPALFLALLVAPSCPRVPAHAQSAAAEGQKLAFDRSKGNCLTCHVIKGGDLPGTIGPELKDIKSKYPNRDDLVAIRHRRNHAQSADRDAAVRTKPDFDRAGDQRDGGFPADAVTQGRGARAQLEEILDDHD